MAWPAQYRRPVEVYAGDDVAFPWFTIKHPDDTLFDLTGWEDWKAAWTGGCGRVPLEVSVSGSTIYITAPAATSRKMEGPGRWDVQAVNAGVTRTWLHGTTKGVKDIAR